MNTDEIMELARECEFVAGDEEAYQCARQKLKDAVNGIISGAVSEANARKTMELATDFGVESLRVGSMEARTGLDSQATGNKWKLEALRERREDARARLYKHVFSAVVRP